MAASTVARRHLSRGGADSASRVDRRRFSNGAVATSGLTGFAVRAPAIFARAQGVAPAAPEFERTAAAGKPAAAATVRTHAPPCQHLVTSNRLGVYEPQGSRRRTEFQWPQAPGYDVPEKGNRRYFSELLIEVNFSFRLVPRPLTTAMIASEIPAAINPYSMAVAPDSSFQNFKTKCFM